MSHFPSRTSTIALSLNRTCAPLDSHLASRANRNANKNALKHMLLIDLEKWVRVVHIEYLSQKESISVSQKQTGIINSHHHLSIDCNLETAAFRLKESIGTIWKPIPNRGTSLQRKRKGRCKSNRLIAFTQSTRYSGILTINPLINKGKDNNEKRPKEQKQRKGLIGRLT